MSYEFSTHVPYYQQIIEDMKQKIVSGTLEEGAKLLNEVDLAKRYGVSRQTLRQAIAELVSAGLLVRVRGLGTFVRRSVIVDDADAFTVFSDFAVESDLWSELVSVKLVMPSAQVTTDVRLDAGARVHEVVLRRVTRCGPVAERTLYIPEPLIPRLAEFLTSRPLESVLDELHLRPVAAIQRFQALKCSREQAALLGMPEGDPVLVWEGTLYTVEGLSMAFVRTVFRGDRFSFVIRQGRARSADPTPA